jgi:hypothetical protein
LLVTSQLVIIIFWALSSEEGKGMRKEKQNKKRIDVWVKRCVVRDCMRRRRRRREGGRKGGEGERR